MHKLAVLNIKEQITLNQLVLLNDEILMDGLTKERLEELTDLQSELINIIQKFNINK